MKKFVVLICLSVIIISCDDSSSNSTTAQPSVKVGLTSNLSINDIAVTGVSFDKEFFDEDNLHDSSTNPTRITIKTPGLYLINADVVFVPNTVGYRALSIRLNGTTAIGGNIVNAATNGSVNTFNCYSCIHYLSSNDYIELLVSEISGGSLDLSSTYTSFSLSRISD